MKRFFFHWTAYLTFISILAGCSAMTGSSGQGTVGKAFWSGQKCEAVADWLEHFKEEFPHEQLTYNPHVYNANLPLINLFRDDVFIPVFGIPYDVAHAEDLNTLNRKVIYSCWHGRKRWESSETYDYFGPLKPFFDQVFGRMHPRMAQQAVIFMQRKNILKDALTEIENFPLDERSFDRLTTILIPRTNEQIAALWPSEIKNFQKISLSKQKSIAQHILETRFADIEFLPDTMETVKTLQEAAPYARAVGDPHNVLARKIAARLEQLIAPRIAAYAQSLAEIPLTLEGRNQSVLWLRKFEADFKVEFKGHEGNRAVMEVSRAWRGKREAIFQATKEDFLKKLLDLPTGPAAKPKHEQLLAETFPLGRDKVLQVYSQYRYETIKRQKTLIERVYDTGKEGIQGLRDGLSDAAKDIIHGDNQ